MFSYVTAPNSGVFMALFKQQRFQVQEKLSLFFAFLVVIRLIFVYDNMRIHLEIAGGFD